MIVHLQAWWFGKQTINCKVHDINPEYKVVDLLCIYFNRIINPERLLGITVALKCSWWIEEVIF